jgi:hypothetical protein
MRSSSSRSTSPRRHRNTRNPLRHHRAPAPSPAWPRGSPRPDGDARHSVHAPCDTARPLRHDRSLRQTRQPGRQRRRRSRPGIAGPSDPGKGPRCPTPSLSPVRHAGPYHQAVPARLNGRLGRAPQDRLREQPLAHPTGREWSTGSGLPPWIATWRPCPLTRSGLAGSWAWWAGPPRSQEPWR